MGICALVPAEKKVLARKVGAELDRSHGKRKTYSIDQIRNASRNQRIPIDWECWAYAFFAAKDDFVRFHQESGEKCDYDFMNRKMVEAVSDSPAVPRTISVVEEGSQDSSWLSDFFDSFDFSDD